MWRMRSRLLSPWRSLNTRDMRSASAVESPERARLLAISADALLIPSALSVLQPDFVKDMEQCQRKMGASIARFPCPRKERHVIWPYTHGTGRALRTTVWRKIAAVWSPVRAKEAKVERTETTSPANGG